ncbi:glutamine amidotransferase-related protein [Aggregatibacter kilianii]|uniref:glutamine amidotransferase-related protein n=1 Tax=Aggregatibacter kilianii TaxID=2025884 RepID=UPI000D646B57|nr:glutamine amidotransferase [Aggregatibacter kilianii]
MHIHFIKHESFEQAGAYLIWAQQRGYEISFSNVYLRDKLPDSADKMDMLIVLGGPQSPEKDETAFPYYDPQAEQRLIQQAIRADKAVVGVCLGAQLIGASYGVGFSHSPNKEIGNFPIFLTDAGAKDDKIAHIGAQLTVGHWHNDMPNLTEQAEVLTYSEGCPRQIVRYAELVYGLQCHMEFTQNIAQDIVHIEKQLNRLSEQYPYVQAAEQIVNFDYRKMNEALFLFLDKLVAAYLKQKEKTF